jgi:5-methylcytosine-specific restriction endonuclease McrA
MSKPKRPNLSAAEVEAMRLMFEEGQPIAVICAAFDVAAITIRQRARRHRWPRGKLLVRRPQAKREIPDAARQAYESGAPLAEVIPLSGLLESALRHRAKSDGWDRVARRRAIVARRREHITPDGIRCRTCQQMRPVHKMKDHGNRTPSRICLVCYTAARRRSKGVMTLAELAAFRRAKRPQKQKYVEPPHRVLYRLLKALLKTRCQDEGVALSGVEYRAKYRIDPDFRAREIARRWARKEAELELRTDGTLTSAVVRKLFASATVCAYCAEPMSPRVKTMDHVIPKSRGGAHSITNVVVCCRSCNSRKHARTPGEWKLSIRVPNRRVA